MYCNCTKFIHIHRGRRSTCGTYRSSVYSRSNFIVRRKVTSKWRGWYRPFRGLLNLLLYVTWVLRLVESTCLKSAQNLKEKCSGKVILFVLVTFQYMNQYLKEESFATFSYFHENIFWKRRKWKLPTYLISFHLIWFIKSLYRMVVLYIYIYIDR